MEKSVKITLIIMVGILLLVVIILANFSTASNTINSNGYSEIEVMPDVISIYFNVETKSATSKVAEDANSEISNKLVDDLVNRGYLREEIQTVSFNIYPNYDWSSGSSRLRDYTVSHMMKIELQSSQSGEVGKIIDIATDAGALVSSVNFELSVEKQNQYKADALKLAAEDAKIKAEATAEGLGKKLGNLVSVSMDNFNYYPWVLYDSASGVKSVEEATTNINPSSQKVSASVSVVFKMK